MRVIVIARKVIVYTESCVLLALMFVSLCFLLVCTYFEAGVNQLA